MERENLIVAGRLIGTNDGWDELETCVLTFYDFKPAEGVPLPAGDICVDFNDGTFGFYDDDGEVLAMYDMVPILAGINKETN